jgi:Co/Zn/Cd efflux system component
LRWGNLASANLIAAKVTGADPKVLAAVIRDAIIETLETWPADPFRTINIRVLILNDKADVANQKLGALLKAIPTAGTAQPRESIVLRPTSRAFSKLQSRS